MKQINDTEKKERDKRNSDTMNMIRNKIMASMTTTMMIIFFVYTMYAHTAQDSNYARTVFFSFNRTVFFLYFSLLHCQTSFFRISHDSIVSFIWWFHTKLCKIKKPEAKLVFQNALKEKEWKKKMEMFLHILNE